MPEGDTVYLSAKNLNAAIAGQLVTRFDLRVPAFATLDLTGDAIEGVAGQRGPTALIQRDAYWCRHCQPLPVARANETALPIR